MQNQDWKPSYLPGSSWNPHSKYLGSLNTCFRELLTPEVKGSLMGNETSIVTSPCLGKLKADITKEEVSVYRKVPVGLYLRTSEMQPGCSVPTLPGTERGPARNIPSALSFLCWGRGEKPEKAARLPVSHPCWTAAERLRPLRANEGSREWLREQFWGCRREPSTQREQGHKGGQLELGAWGHQATAPESWFPERERGQLGKGRTLLRDDWGLVLPLCWQLCLGEQSYILGRKSDPHLLAVCQEPREIIPDNCIWVDFCKLCQTDRYEFHFFRIALSKKKNPIKARCWVMAEPKPQQTQERAQEAWT